MLIQTIRKGLRWRALWYGVFLGSLVLSLWASAKIYELDGSWIVFFLPLSLLGLGFTLLMMNRQVANALKGEHSVHTVAYLLSIMCHEIRGAFHIALGISDALADVPMDPKKKVYLARSDGAMSSLVRIFEDLLEISKEKEIDLKVLPENFNLNRAADEWSRIFLAQSTQRGMAFEWEAHIPPTVEVNGDELRIRQILIHCIGNLLRKGGRDKIQLRCNFINRLDGGYLHFIVEKDSDFGEENEDQRLGFELTEYFLNRMGGQIEKSRNKVSIRIPLMLVGESVQREKSAAEKGLAFRGTHILVAEDGAPNRLLIEKLLQRLGCEVEFAEDGREVLKRLDPERHDLILMDCQMPEINGFEATQEIRHRFGKKIPIVALTAAGTEEDRQRCMDSGMDDSLLKPIRRKDLEAMLQKWLKVRNPLPRLSREVLTSLEALGEEVKDEFFVDRLVREFIVDGGKRMGKAQVALEEEDVDQLKALAHGLRSTSAEMGGLEMSWICEQLERGPRDLLFLGEYFKKLSDEFNFVSEELRKKYPNAMKEVDSHSLRQGVGS